MLSSIPFGFAARALSVLVAAVAVMLSPMGSGRVYSQNDASGPNQECECHVGPASPPPIVAPKNFCLLVDGRRYDISTLRLFTKPMPGIPAEEIEASATSFLDSGMYRVTPEVELPVGRGYGYRLTISVSPEPFVEGAVGGFDAESDFIDEEPPTVGDLQVTTRIFTNECGSQALYLEDSGTRDNFTGNVYRLPVVVEIRSLERDLTFRTFTTTYGTTGGSVRNVIAYYPFTGWCVGDRGLESLEFELGERVAVEMTVFDYACNGAPPVTQEIEWPIEREGGGGAGGNGGSDGSGAAGAAGNDGPQSGGGGSCSAGTSGSTPFGVVLMLCLAVVLRRGNA